MSVSVALRPPLRRVISGGATTPERLRRVEGVLVIGCLLLGVVGVLGGIARSNAVHEGSTRVAALTTAAADLYQSLADADASATTGYVSGGLEPATVRARFDDDIARAGERLATAAGLLPAGDPTIAAISTIGEQLPVYTGLVENARALNRLGLPLGESYLGSASKLMRATILPAVEQVRAAESSALASAYRQGGALPFAALAIGLAVLLGVVDLALRERRRTNRVLNVGLLVGGIAILTYLAWWSVTVLVADSRLRGAHSHSDAGAALDDTRIAVLQARSNESLVLVARSGGGGSSDQGFTAQLQTVLGDSGQLAAAQRADPEFGDRIAVLQSAATAWGDAHRGVRQLDDGGQYPQAVQSVVGRGPTSSGGAFDVLDGGLATAIRDERAAAALDIEGADAALSALAWASGVLTLVAVGAVVVGVGQRVGEYR